MSKTKKPYWKKKIPPAHEGWYWCKYKSKGGTVVCPCDVYWLANETFIVRTARNDVYSKNTAERFGVIWFGDRIEAPKK